MKGYILSVLGIVLVGIFVDVIVPNGAINKYIKSIYSIFVVAVMLNPLFNLLKNTKDFTIKYQDYEVNVNLLNYIYKTRITEHEKELENSLKEQGFANVDIILNYSIENDELVYNICEINLQNLVINADKQHINKYDFITNLVKESTNLTEEEIVFNE